MRRKKNIYPELYVNIGGKGVAYSISKFPSADF